MVEDNIVNEFDGVDIEDEAPETEFSDVPEDDKSNDNGFEELAPGDFQQETFLKNPEVGETLIFTVKKVGRNPKTEQTNKTTGEKFHIGLKKKDGSIMRTDIKCEEGLYTISAWEIFYKLFGTEGILTKYGKKHNTFSGCKISIKRNYDGSYAQKKIPDVMKLMDFTQEKAEAFRKEVGQALKDSKLYEVKNITDVKPAPDIEKL